MEIPNMIRLDNDSLNIPYNGKQELYDLLREIRGYTEQEIADKFSLSLSAVQNWTKRDREPPEWIIVYLLDTIELKLAMIGYMLKLKKASFVLHEIKQTQQKIVDSRIEAVGEIEQTPLTINIGNLITDDKAMDTAIISNMNKILTRFREDI